MATRARNALPVPRSFDELVRQVEAVLLSARAEIERAWVQTYHEIGRLINSYVLENRARADYGGRVYERLSQRSGISVRTLRECAQFQRTYPIRRKSAKYDRYLADVFLATGEAEEIFLNNTLLENNHADRKDSWEFRDWEKEFHG